MRHFVIIESPCAQAGSPCSQELIWPNGHRTQSGSSAKQYVQSVPKSFYKRCSNRQTLNSTTSTVQLSTLPWIVYFFGLTLLFTNIFVTYKKYWTSYVPGSILLWCLLGGLFKLYILLLSWDLSHFPHSVHTAIRIVGIFGTSLKKIFASSRSLSTATWFVQAIILSLKVTILTGNHQIFQENLGKKFEEYFLKFF